MDQVSYEHRQASMTDSFDVFPSARPLPLTLPNGKPAIEAWPLDQSILHLKPWFVWRGAEQHVESGNRV